MAADRARAFLWTMYPESLPDNYLQIVDDLRVPAVLAYHDRDVWTVEDEKKDPAHKAGELKKPHIHGMITFGGKKSLKQVLEMLAPLGVTYAEPVHDIQTYTRYLLHKDHPEKFQYDKDCLVCFNGIALDFSRKLTQSDVNAILKEMSEFIRENVITEFHEIWFYSLEHEPDWFQVLADRRAYVINKLVTSIRNSIAKERPASDQEWNDDE